MRQLKPSQYPAALIWWFMRRIRYWFWGFFHRFGFPRKFKRIGRKVRFNGLVRVEHPFSDISIGDHSMLGIGCYFLATEHAVISIGDHCQINDHCYITSNYRIDIGNHVSIGEQVSIRDYDHDFSDTRKPIQWQGLTGAPIKIGDDVWIGRGVTITSGITIGRGTVIGANAVVTKDLPEWSVAVGIPARVIRTRMPLPKANKTVVAS